jgi:hypothetical protein
MSTERKNPLKRDQALNDATSGQLGEEPRPRTTVIARMGFNMCNDRI